METKIKSVISSKGEKIREKEAQKLNKLGEWLKNPNRETIVVYDMKAVMK